MNDIPALITAVKNMINDVYSHSERWRMHLYVAYDDSELTAAKNALLARLFNANLKPDKRKPTPVINAYLANIEAVGGAVDVSEFVECLRPIVEICAEFCGPSDHSAEMSALNAADKVFRDADSMTLEFKAHTVSVTARRGKYASRLEYGQQYDEFAEVYFKTRNKTDKFLLLDTYLLKKDDYIKMVMQYHGRDEYGPAAMVFSRGSKGYDTLANLYVGIRKELRGRKDMANKEYKALNLQIQPLFDMLAARPYMFPAFSDERKPTSDDILQMCYLLLDVNGNTTLDRKIKKR